MTASVETVVRCHRCRVSFPLPRISEAERARLVSAVRAGQHVETIQLLRELAGFDLRDGKAVEVHITRRPGICVRCRTPLPSRGQTECPKCGSLNLDW